MNNQLANLGEKGFFVLAARGQLELVAQSVEREVLAAIDRGGFFRFEPEIGSTGIALQVVAPVSFCPWCGGETASLISRQRESFERLVSEHAVLARRLHGE